MPDQGFGKTLDWHTAHEMAHAPLATTSLFCNRTTFMVNRHSFQLHLNCSKTKYNTRKKKKKKGSVKETTSI